MSPLRVSGEYRGRQQGSHRGARRESGDRGREIRRLLHHRLVLHAVRGHPLAGRFRQSGAAADRGRHAKKKPDQTHQFGYSRVRYVYAFVVAIVLFSVGGLYSLYEGIHKFQHPEDLHDLPIAIAVLLFAVALEAFSFRTALKEANKSRGRATCLRMCAGCGNPNCRSSSWRMPARWSV